MIYIYNFVNLRKVLCDMQMVRMFWKGLIDIIILSSATDRQKYVNIGVFGQLIKVILKVTSDNVRSHLNIPNVIYSNEIGIFNSAKSLSNRNLNLDLVLRFPLPAHTVL